MQCTILHGKEDDSAYYLQKLHIHPSRRTNFFAGDEGDDGDILHILHAARKISPSAVMYCCFDCLAHTSVETPCAYTTYMVSICNGSVYGWSDLGAF